MSPAPDDPAPSPCIGICRMDDAQGVCEGCWRTLAEIAEWGRATERRRHDILRAVQERRQTHPTPGRRDLS